MLPLAAVAVSFAVVYAATPRLAAYLGRRGVCVPDVNKRGNPMVPRPGGPAIAAGISGGMALLYWHTGDAGVLAMLGTIAAAFLVGYADDRRAMPGWFKPAALVAASLPMVLAGAYDPRLEFPLFGAVHIPVLYAGVVAAVVSVTGNTINSIDVMNGVASGYVCIAAAAVGAVLALLGRWDALAACAVLAVAAAAFYRYHRLPSRVFPGDSGALALGVAYGCVAVYGGVEVVAAVALLPCIINSFLFLHSVRRIVDRSKIKHPAVVRDENMVLRDSGDARAPVTLVRLILRDGPRDEAGVAREIFRLGYLSAALAVATGTMMLVFP